MNGAGRDEDDDANRDEFLFHLSRGAEYLRDARVHESKEELERALRLRPTDPHSQDMLAQVYYRLGVYPRAVELYRDLLTDYPDSPALYVNLALVFLKTGQPYEAHGLLLEAVRLDADHARAWGYLGLVQARLGRYADARESFLRSGHASMAERMDQIIQRARASMPEAAAAPPVREEVAHVHAVVEGALGQLEPNEPFEPPPGIVRRRSTAELARITLPPRPIAPAFLALDVPTVADWIERTAVVFPAPGMLAVDPDGNALVQIGDPGALGDAGGLFCVRLSGLRAAHGGARGANVPRAARTQTAEGFLGGDDDPLAAVHGPAQLVLRAPPGARLTVVRLGNESLFVRESTLYAMSGGIRHESAAIEVAGLAERLVVTHLLGPGVIALRTPRTPRTLSLSGDMTMRVALDAVVGWSGRIFPSRSDSGGFAGLVALSGEGAVIVQ